MGERTIRLPIRRDAVLWSGLSEPWVVRNLRKEEPGTYLAVKALLSDPDYQQARTAMVRNNSFGHLAVLLTVSGAGKRFTISTWMVDKGATIQKNITANSVEDQVRWQVDAYDFDSEYDVGILVQDPYVSAAVTLYEASFLVTNSRSGGGYVNRCVNDIRRRPSQPLIQWRFHPHTVHRDRRLRSTQGPSDA